MDFVVGQVAFILYLPDGQVKVWGNFSLKLINLSTVKHRKSFWASRSVVWASKSWLQLARSPGLKIKLLCTLIQYIKHLRYMWFSPSTTLQISIQWLSIGKTSCWVHVIIFIADFFVINIFYYLRFRASQQLRT